MDQDANTLLQLIAIRLHLKLCWCLMTEVTFEIFLAALSRSVFKTIKSLWLLTVG